MWSSRWRFTWSVQMQIVEWRCVREREGDRERLSKRNRISFLANIRCWILIYLDLDWMMAAVDWVGVQDVHSPLTSDLGEPPSYSHAPPIVHFRSAIDANRSAMMQLWKMIGNGLVFGVVLLNAIYWIYCRNAVLVPSEIVNLVPIDVPTIAPNFVVCFRWPLGSRYRQALNWVTVLAVDFAHYFLPAKYQINDVWKKKWFHCWKMSKCSLTWFSCLPGNIGPTNVAAASNVDDVYALCASSSMYNWSDIFCATLLAGFSWLPNMCEAFWNIFISFASLLPPAAPPPPAPPPPPVEVWLRFSVSASELGELGGESLISGRGVIVGVS